MARPVKPEPTGECLPSHSASGGGENTCEMNYFVLMNQARNGEALLVFTPGQKKIAVEEQTRERGDAELDGGMDGRG
jgi:hypothetical protein